MNRATHQCTFARVPVGATFYKDGNTYQKKSSRTAHLDAYDRRFYFGQREWVTVDKATCDAILKQQQQ